MTDTASHLKASPADVVTSTGAAVQSSGSGSKEGQSGKRKPEEWKGGVLLALLLVLVTGATWTLTHRHTRVSSAESPKLNEAALRLASYMVAEDLKTGLEGGDSLLVKAQGSTQSWTNIDQRVTAKQYESRYADNEIAADQLYRDKRILVSGAVSRIEKDFSGNGNLWFAGSGLLGVQASLNEQGEEAAMSLHPGQKVILVCVGSGG